MSYSIISRSVPSIAQAALSPDTGVASSAARATAAGAFEFVVKDIVYGRSGGKERLARLYQPAGTGPFPAVLFVHGGAWNNKDRTDGQNTLLDLAAEGIVVLAIDFRNAPEAPYPASLQDINYAIRWFKAHAAEFGTTPDRIGLYGTSSGGHQVLLSAIRPDDRRYRALPLAEAPDMDAKVAFVVSGWGVLWPHERYKLAKSKGSDEVVKNHNTFFASEDEQIEASPGHALERGEKGLFVPPALLFQGTADQWTSVALSNRLTAAWRKAGGVVEELLLEGEKHTFVTEHPASPNSVKAVEALKALVKKHGGGNG
jgi:acetyl esterase/lipase